MSKAIVMEFTTTATVRPVLLARTYASFTTRMHGVDYAKSTLYLNVDPVGRADCTVKEVCAVAREYFGTVRTRTPATGNYASAYRWLWSQPQGEVFFNLEDDWEVVEPFDLRELVAVPKVTEWVGVALRAYTHKDNGDPYPYKSCPTSPALLRSSFFQSFALKMDDVVNPEVQLHRYMKQEFFAGKRRRPGTRMRCYPFDGPLRAVIRDTGREWMERYPVARPSGAKEGFTTWTQ